MELFPKIVMVPKTSGRRSLMLDALLMKCTIGLDIKTCIKNKWKALTRLLSSKNKP